MSIKICLILSLFVALSFTMSMRPKAFNPPAYKQSDARWKDIILGFGPDTIGQAGCLMTSITSAIAGEGVLLDGQVPIPPTMNEWLKNNGGFAQGDLFVWDSVRPLGLEFIEHRNKTTEIIPAFMQGKVVILNVNQGHHYVLGLGVTATGYSVMDPATPGKLIFEFNEVVRAGIYNWNPKH